MKNIFKSIAGALTFVLIIMNLFMFILGVVETVIEDKDSHICDSFTRPLEYFTPMSKLGCFLAKERK